VVVACRYSSSPPSCSCRRAGSPWPTTVGEV
jgi:hypothetical protein